MHKTQNDDLVDVAEWAEVRGLALQLPCPTALTADLWDLTLELPFGQVGEHHAQQRLLDVLAAATRALRHALRSRHPDPHEPLAVSFAAPLPSRSSDPKWRPLELTRGPDETGEIAMTIALADHAKTLAPVHEAGSPRPSDLRAPVASVRPGSARRSGSARTSCPCADPASPRRRSCPGGARR